MNAKKELARARKDCEALRDIVYLLRRALFESTKSNTELRAEVDRLTRALSVGVKADDACLLEQNIRLRSENADLAACVKMLTSKNKEQSL